MFPARGWFWSLTLWDSPAAMKRFARSGAHGRIMAAYAAYAEVGVFRHAEVMAMPGQAEVLAIWDAASGRAA